MNLFGNKGEDDGSGLNIDIEKVLAATGGALTGASGALAPEPEPEIDWTMVAVVGGLGLGLVLLLTNRRR
jgi:hypothetical protein